MEFTGVINYPLLKLGLSQIYLNQSKIEAIEKWFNPNDMSIFTPLPVHAYGNGKYTLTDGHSRAYVAYKKGLTHIPVIYDNDDMVAGELGQKLYRVDIEWCNRFSIDNISKLEHRIISNDEYQRFWIERCDRNYNLLVQTTEEERELMQTKKPNLFLYGASNDLQEIYFENSQGETFIYKYQHLFGGIDSMNTYLQIYSDEYKADVIVRIAKFFGFLIGLSKGKMIDKIDDNISAQNLRDWTSGNNQLYMIMCEENVIGFIRIGYRGGNVAWIEDIFVDEEFRNKGIATQSIRQAEEIVRAKPPYNAICLDVVPRNIEALKLYHKLGYDMLSTVTLRKEFQHKEPIGIQNLRGMDFKF